MEENKNTNDLEVFTSCTGMNLMEIERLIDEKLLLLNNKLSGNITDDERSNEGYLLWNCKMILRNISMSASTITNKFKSDISDETYQKYIKLADSINDDQKTWISMEAIKNTYEKIEKIESVGTKSEDLNNLN